MNKILTVLATTTSMLLPLAATAQDHDFRVGLITPPVHVWNQEARAMGETLSETSDGRFSVTTFPSGQLGSESTMLQQLQTGALDMAWLTSAGLTLRVPDMSALHAPFLVDNIADAAKVLRSDEAIEILDALPAATGTVGLCYAMTGMRQLMTKDPIESAEDLDGMRFRITPAPAIQTFFEMFGAAPAPMPLTQVYDALANGQIDAIDMDYESIINFGYHDHASNLMETNHHLFPMVALVSGRVWAQLSPEDQTIVRAAAQQHCDATIDRFVEEEAGKLEKLKGIEGLTVTEDVSADFFGDIVERWDADWSKETPYVEKLRALVATY
ncbi:MULTISPECIES: TRAP transporter substrate-binding protein [Pacificibacter]|uniref:TRAP transporter substrate-binding protein n=1 Tax=Pacificibacter TaxID=1042323 RepID=UPI001C09885B|nr:MULTISPECIES: TRAP transporter substrate-binding protein [Pacificibacter]MBU2937616.1 TRAP transporter substrate-binding protein [Pacificibacter marinus]MDO6616911.1 TRAP transporter substrate-binding protein [Pacificibacter sp. 1_MG-2023]